MELHTLLWPNYGPGVRRLAHRGFDSRLRTLMSGVESVSPPWSQVGAQRMGPVLHSDLPANSPPRATIRPTRIAWFDSPPLFLEGTRMGSNQRRVASRSDPCIKQGLRGCTRVQTQQTTMTLRRARARELRTTQQTVTPTTLLKSHENSHQRKIQFIKQ
jgi:hypothetical protein